jgi:hypothetical protein
MILSMNVLWEKVIYAILPALSKVIKATYLFYSYFTISICMIGNSKSSDTPYQVLVLKRY